MFEDGCSGYLRNIIVVLLIIQVFSQTDVIDVCDVQRMTLNFEGHTGTVVFRGADSGVKSPCVLRLQAIPSCYISISPANSFQYNSCSKTSVSALCTPGCSYAYVFDGFYYNETLKLISNSNWTSFHTFSSVLYVAVCHTPNTHVDMELKFTVLGRRYFIEGDTSTNTTGEINSTFFPKSYIQNGEQTTFLFTSKRSTDKVILIFDDFNLAPGSALYFNPAKDYPSPIVINDQSARPIVISTGHQLQFIIDYGWSGSSQNEYLGFKATYRFISENEHYIRPTTYCGKYYLTLHGGHIEFRPSRFDVPYDCVWVVKTQPGYKSTYMKLDRFSSDYGNINNFGSVKVEIHKGLTSRGRIVGTLLPYNGGLYRDYDDKEGFYIRLRGTFKSAVTFKMSFTSYTDYYESSCNTATHFRCSSGQCIPNKLACDHIDHCKDGTDETIGCSGSDDFNGGDSTLTVSVIIPMVVSIFLLVVLCILFVLVRRCRQARQFNNMMVRESNPRRRGRRDDYLQRPPDAPPTYDEALITGIPVPDGSYPADSYDGPPKPPTYTEAISTPLINQSSLQSPPYTSREDLSVNQPFLGDGTGLTNDQPGTSGSNALERPELNDGQDPVSTSTQTNRPYKRVHHRRSKDQPSIHLQNTGQLPSLPSIQASVGTQSMYNISDIGRIDMTRARSEQILSPKDLTIGIDNHDIGDHQGQKTNRQSRLYRGQAVSNLDLPTVRNYDSTDNSQPKNLNRGIDNHGFVDDHGQIKDSQSGLLRGQTVSNLDLPTVKECNNTENTQQLGNNRREPNKSHQYRNDTSGNKHSTTDKHKTARNLVHEDKTKKNKPSAIDRLRPSDPSLSKKFQEELNKRGNKRKDNSNSHTDSASEMSVLNSNGAPVNKSHSSVRGDNSYLGTQKEENTHVKNARPPGTVNAFSSKNPPSHQRRDQTNPYKSERGFPRNDLNSQKGFPNNDLKSKEDRNHPLVHKSNTDIRQINDSKYRDDVTRGSNISLNLNSGNKRQIHQSSMSLNENMLSRGAQSTDKEGECAGHTSPSLSYMNLNDLSESIDV